MPMRTRSPARLTSVEGEGECETGLRAYRVPCLVLLDLGILPECQPSLLSFGRLIPMVGSSARMPSSMARAIKTRSMESVLRAMPGLLAYAVHDQLDVVPLKSGDWQSDQICQEMLDQIAPLALRLQALTPRTQMSEDTSGQAH